MENEKYPYPIRFVIFDNDGTLLDTLPIYSKVLTHFVKPPFPEELVHRVNGASDFDACKVFVEFFKMSVTPEQLYEDRKKLLAELLPTSKILPGAAETVKTLHNKYQIPMAIATGSMRDIHELKLVGSDERVQMFNSFDLAVCGSDVAIAKPNPAIFFEAAKRLCDKHNLTFVTENPTNDVVDDNIIYPRNVIVVEDALNGIRAACAAGMPSVFVPNDGTIEFFQQKFKEHNISPTYTLQTLEQFPFDKFDFKKVA